MTYEEAASKPSLSKTSFDMGTSVTIHTNRQSSIATHTMRYSFFSSNGTIASGVTDSSTWTPPVSLAAQIPSATSGWGTIYCDTYVNGSLVSTNSCAFQLTVPASIVPFIYNVAISEATAGIADRFGGYVRTRSKLAVSITAAGVQGSSISAYRTSIDGVTYSGASFTTNALNTAGSLILTVTVADSRGRTDGTKVRISAKVSGSSVGGKNTLSCTVYYKLSSAESWVQATTLAPSNYVFLQAIFCSHRPSIHSAATTSAFACRTLFIMSSRRYPLAPSR